VKRFYPVYCWLLLILPSLIFGEERFPPPEFESEYSLPSAQHPAARAEWLSYLDIAVLAGALALAGWLALRRRSRRGLFALTAFSIAYFGFFRQGCVCPVGSVQNVALSIGQPEYALPVVVAAFFLLPLVAALFVGRAFCAGVCPLGAAQDVVLLKPLKVPTWLEHALGVLPYIYLGAAVLFASTGSAFLICQYDPFISLYRMSGTPLLLGITAGMLALGTVVGRPYCRFLCPYGVLLRWLSPLARWRVSIAPKECVQCHLCKDACPYGAIRTPTPAENPGGRREGKSRLALYLLLLPVLLVASGALGYLGGAAVSGQHTTVRQANRVWLEEHGKVEGTTLESEAFYRHGQPLEDLLHAASAIRRQFNLGGLLLGLWIGLVIGLKLVFLAVRRRRTDYEADPAACLACGRCYRFCPEEQAPARVLEKIG
jgi:ferredoxin